MYDTQLSFLDNFDRLARRDVKLVEEIISNIKNTKYLRINTQPSDLKYRSEIIEEFNNMLYWLAFLAFKRARFIDKYKGNNQLEDFLKITRDHPDVMVTDILSNEYLTGCYFKAHQRLKTIFMAYKELLQDDRQITKRILDNFDQIHNLAHAV